MSKKMQLAASSRREAALSVGRPGIDELIERFVSDQDVGPASKITYTRALKRFFGWVRDSGIQPDTMQREHILAYKQFLYNSDFSAYTISNYLSAVRTFFAWTETVKLYPNIARNIKGAKRTRGFRKECLTVEQVNDLLSNIETETLSGMRDYAIISLLVRTGLRTIEIARADIGDIQQNGGTVKLYVHGKGRDDKGEFVVLEPGALKPIQRYLRERGKAPDSDPLFASVSNKNRSGRLTTRSIRRIVRNWFTVIDLVSEKMSAHSLRHTAVTLALLSGATVQEAQQMARHSNINTTLNYAHNIDRVKDAAEKKIESLLAAG